MPVRWDALGSPLRWGEELSSRKLSVEWWAEDYLMAYCASCSLLKARDVHWTQECKKRGHAIVPGTWRERKTVKT